MSYRLSRRGFLQTTTAAGFVALLPPGAYADINAVPRSNYGFATTADEVVAGLDLTGKTVLITGCNSGLGYESMRVLAARGARVIGTARTQEKAATACDEVGGTTVPLVCELSDFETVIACAEQVQAMDTTIDVLMCNAGIMALPKLEQVYGLEKQFVVNHLGHFLLTQRLLPQLQAAPAARVVVLSSIGYQNAPAEGIQFDNLSGETKYKPFAAYGQSKLSNALFARELARRCAGSNVTANSVHPGLVATNLGRYISGKPRDQNAPLRKGFKTAVQGAATQVYVAADPAMKTVTGYYFEDCNPVEPKGPHMHDDALAKRLWDVSETLISERT